MAVVACIMAVVACSMALVACSMALVAITLAVLVCIIAVGACLTCLAWPMEVIWLHMLQVNLAVIWSRTGQVHVQIPIILISSVKNTGSMPSVSKKTRILTGAGKVCTSRSIKKIRNPRVNKNNPTRSPKNANHIQNNAPAVHLALVSPVMKNQRMMKLTSP